MYINFLSYRCSICTPYTLSEEFFLRALHSSIAAFEAITTANHDAKYPFPTSTKGPLNVAKQDVPAMNAIKC